jgi:hypothetical protein
MKDRNKNIDEVFRSKIVDYSAPPPDSVWESIELSLQKSKRKKVIIFYFKIAAGIIFLAGMTALLSKIANFKNKETVYQVTADKAANTIPVNQNIITTNSIQTEKKQYTSKIKLKRVVGYDTTSAITEAELLIISENESIDEIKRPDTNSMQLVYEIQPYQIENNLQGEVKTESSENKIQETSKPALVIEKNPNEQLFDDLLSSDEISKKRDMVWIVGGQAGPQYTYRKLTNENQIATSNTNFDKYDSPLLAYAGGLQIEVEPARRLSVQSGIFYSRVGQKISSRYTDNEKNDYFPSTEYASNNRPVEIVNSIGNFTFNEEDENSIRSTHDYVSVSYNSSDEKANFNGRQYFEYVEIPFILKYKIIDQKLDIKIIGGVNTDILVNNYVKISNSSNVSLKIKADALNTFNYSGTIGFGLDYPLSKRMLFNLEPFFKYYLSPINSSSAADAHPYMIGIMTGLNYSF